LSTSHANDVVLIDVTRLLQRRILGRLPTGIDRVGLEYVRHFGERSTALVRLGGLWVELSRHDSTRVFRALLSTYGNCNLLLALVLVKALPRSVFFRKFYSGRFYFNTGHTGLERANFSQRLKSFGLRPMFFIHDLIPLSHPEYCRPLEAQRHRARLNTLLSSGHGVIANSAVTLQTLASYAITNDLPMPLSTAARLAPAKLDFAGEASPSHKPYFVMLGTIEPRKNHVLMLMLWRQLIERLGEDAPCLVIIGQRGWECENVVDLLERCETIKGFVFEHPACTDGELARWLAHAKALLFPSFVEGFGMPLVEALSLGCPVLASDLPAFREIAGNVPEYIDPLDGKRWMELVTDYALDGSLSRIAQQERIEEFVVPTWAAHFEQVESLMMCLRDATENI
jgi:glycosyltransferase involved in cell wall biosynthesis